MILGVDISLWQQSVDFPLLKKQGVEFVIIKCSDGGALDPMYRQNYELAEKAGMIIFAYHWMRPQISATRQLETILLANGGFNPAGIFLDVEQAGANAQNTQGPFTWDEPEAYLANDTAKPPMVLPTLGVSALVLVNALNMHLTPGADPKTTIGAMAKGAKGKTLESANFYGETWLRIQYEGWMTQDIHGWIYY